MNRIELNHVCTALDQYIGTMKDCPEKETLLDLLMQYDVAAEDAEFKEFHENARKAREERLKVVRDNNVLKVNFR